MCGTCKAPHLTAFWVRALKGTGRPFPQFPSRRSGASFRRTAGGHSDILNSRRVPRRPLQEGDDTPKEGWRSGRQCIECAVSRPGLRITIPSRRQTGNRRTVPIAFENSGGFQNNPQAPETVFPPAPEGAREPYCENINRGRTPHRRRLKADGLFPGKGKTGTPSAEAVSEPEARAGGRAGR